MDSQAGRVEDLEDDLLERILILLESRDLCALASCSKSLWKIGCRDGIWASVFKRRWPAAIPYKQPHEDWRTSYAHRHLEMASLAGAVIEFVRMYACEESLEVANYLNALDLLCVRDIGFQDVLINLFSPALSVLVNLIGLHYSLVHLKIQDDAVRDALVGRKISDRHICFRWWSMGVWSNGFRRRDEMHMKIASLYELTEPRQRFLFKVMERGTVHEVLRVQISADFKSSAWVWRDMHSQR
ncbi:uncharacterized protein LOC9631098 isoform X2 [Selaginella moellendorffii]|uniref:uncharacterized protein LOC9631098 isoform X2 n=1 Tax=Selaginella moellendorffii TaxID=88036 RepID=UPI000D1CF643|nr:uncharacterized protein LOC9631098 isoform X2 [Selaginella moellendorffii]|eukprot:XP_024528463.1 uncharacterized protein LOC9631098 isoform X2 [Selaginella moellendorffii]